MFSPGYWRPRILNVQLESARRVGEQQEVLPPALRRRGRGLRGHGEGLQQTRGRPPQVLHHGANQSLLLPRQLTPISRL